MPRASRPRSVLTEAEKLARRNKSIALREGIENAKVAVETTIRELAAEKNR